jgi:hypothetical protein
MERKFSFKYVVFFGGVLTYHCSNQIGRGQINTMIQMADHRFSRGISKIVVEKFTPPPPKLTPEVLYQHRLDMVVDEAIADGSAQKLFEKWVLTDKTLNW